MRHVERTSQKMARVECKTFLLAAMSHIAPSLYQESTELCADSIESHPYLPYVFAESTYQVDQDKTTDVPSPSYTRRGRCRLRRADVQAMQSTA